MNASQVLIRAVRGPLLLIAVGTLFAIDHAGLYFLHQTWPALIILLGVLKLAEWAVARQSVAPPPPAGGMAR